MESMSASAGVLTKGAARTEVAEARRAIPIKVWATIGAAILAFEAFVIVKWVTGPYFESVPTGPTPVPDWMKVSLISMQVGFTALWAWVVWHYVIRPWRRERRFTTEGLLCMALFVFAWFQDPLANYVAPVFTYNAYLVNVGSWLNEVPGVVTPGQPGAQLPEPLWTAAIYPGVILMATLLGTWVMRQAKARWPQMGTLGLIGLVFAFFVVFDVVLEGLILMPLGAYTYAGSPDWSAINDSHYYKYTVLEGVFFGAVWTCWASLLYFKDDKGRTIVERGIERVQASGVQKTALRFLAIGGFVGVTMLACVNIPYMWVASHTDPYPVDTQERSYFLDGMCGEGTNTACFGQSVPLPQGNGSARVGPDGELQVPEGTELPTVVPLERGN